MSNPQIESSWEMWVRDAGAFSTAAIRVTCGSARDNTELTLVFCSAVVVVFGDWTESRLNLLTSCRADRTLKLHFSLSLSEGVTLIHVLLICCLLL